MKYLKTLCLSLICLALLVSSCERESYEETTDELIVEVLDQEKSVVSILLDHGWSIQEQDSRHKYCQLDGAGLIPCDGGTCVGFRNYRGHPFCVGCSRGGVIDSEAIGCTGLNGDFVLILGEIAEVNPIINIDYLIIDDNGEVVGSDYGHLEDKLKSISDTMKPNPKYTLNFSFK